MAYRWSRLYSGTAAEHALEDAVAALGVPYRTQFPGFKYGFRFFPDFFLPTLKLVIEVDDPSHDRDDKAAADAERTATLESFGWTVVRCTNENALNDPHGTVRALLKGAGLWPLPNRLPLLRDSLPVPKKAPQKNRRAAKSAARRARRRGSARPRGTSRRTPQSPRRAPSPYPAATQAPQPIPTP